MSAGAAHGAHDDSPDGAAAMLEASHWKYNAKISFDVDECTKMTHPLGL